MRVKEWMTPNPVAVSPRTSVLTARRTLRQFGLRYLPVVVGDRLVGVVSGWDLQVPDHEVTAFMGSLDWDLLIGRYRAVETVMRRPVLVTYPDESLVCAARNMVAKGVGVLPVAERGAVVGILTLFDCVRGLLELERRYPHPETKVATDPDEYKATPAEFRPDETVEAVEQDQLQAVTRRS